MVYIASAGLENDESWIDQLSNAATKGGSSAIASGVIGMYNTGVALANSLGADYEQRDSVEFVDDLLGSDVADYYSRNQGAIDGVGFMLTSIIPGTLAMKAVRAGQKVVAATKPATMLGQGLRALSAPNTQVTGMYKAIRKGNSALSQMQGVRLNLYANGFRQAAIESFAFETAAVLVNNQNSFMNPENLDYFDAVASNADSIMFGTILGGGVGGVISGITDYKKLRIAQAKTDTEFYKAANVVDRTVEAAAPGDNLAVQLADLKFTPSGREAPGQVFQRQLEAADQIKKDQIKKTLLDLTPETLDKKRVKGDSTYSQIADDMFKIVTDPNVTAEEASKAFGLLRSVDYAGKPSKFTKSAGFELDSGLDAISGAKRKTIMESAWEGVKLTNKENITTARGKLRELVNIGRSDKLDENGWKAIFSHGSESALSELLFTTKSGQGYAEEIFKVIKAQFPRINKELNAIELGKLSNLELGQKLSSGFRPDKPGQYLGLAVKALDGLDPKVASKLAPKLSKIVEDNNVLRSKFVNNDIYFNLRTREFSALPTAVRAADLGKMETKKGRLFYGAQGERSISLQNVTFKPLDADVKVADLTAQWAATQTKEFKLAPYVKKGIEDDNLPILNRLANEWESGSFVFDPKNPPKTAKGVEFRAAEEVKAFILTKKQNMLSSMLASKKYSTEELAEILDVKLGFVSRYGVPDRNGYDLVLRNGNYLRTENVRMTYDAADYERTMKVGRGMAEVERRLAGLREERNLFASRYFGAFSKELPASASQLPEHFNAASGITSASSTQTLLKAYQAENLSEMFFQGIGKFINVMRTKRTEDISAAVGGYASKIKTKPQAVAEVASINAKLAQGDYGVISGAQLKQFSDFIPEQYFKDAVVDETKQYIMPSRLIRDVHAGELSDDLASYFNWNGAELKVFKIADDDVGNMFRGLADDNLKFVIERNQYKTLVGEQGGWNEYSLPALPLDIMRAPELATVEFVGQTKFGVGKGLIAARNSQELQAKIRALKSSRNDVKVTEVSRTENRARLLGDFDNDLSLSESFSNPDMRKLGLAWDVLPEADPRLVDDFMANAIKRRFNLDRQVVRAKYHEEFKMLELADEVVNPVRQLGKDSVQSKAVSAQKKTLNAALGVQNYDEYRGLRTVQEKSAQAMEIMYGNMAGAAHKLSSALSPSKLVSKAAKDEAWENLNKVMRDYDLPEVYKGAEDYIISTTKAPRDMVSSLISRSNSVISALMLRADFTQPIVSAFSTPITLMPELNSLRRMIGSQVFDDIAKQVGGVKVPGTDQKFFSNYKVVAKAVADLWKRPELLQTYKEQGLVGHTLQEIVQAVDGISVAAGKGDVKMWEDALTKAGKGLTYFSDKMDEITRFIAARSTELILDDVIKAAPRAMADRIGSLKYSIMNSVVTKTHGNYVASQRPTLFQGWAGQAIGLFQTYQFNLLQAAGRHIADKNSKAMMQMLFYQSGFFGVQSIPGFQLVNEHIAKQNNGEADIYSELDVLTGSDVAEFLLYGGASQLTTPIFGTGVSFYTRGDLTPRTPLLIPTSVADIPIVSFTTKILGNMAATIDAAQGSLSMDTVWQALAHNGINRPLAGFGAVMLGERTTRQGTTMYDYDEVDNIGLHTVARLMGTTTMDEALAMSSFYRAKSYQSYRQAELNELGVEVKAAIRAGEPTSPVDFMSQYVETGGDYENFNRWYQTQASSVDKPEFDNMRNNLNSPEGRYLMNVMGSD